MVPGSIGGGLRFARATMSWPFETQCMALNHESLPPLINATHFIVLQTSRVAVKAVGKTQIKLAVGNSFPRVSNQHLIRENKVHGVSCQH